MNRGIKYCMLLLLPILMVGCNDVDKDVLKKNIEVSNRRIESMMKDYNTSKFKATKFYEDSLKYLSGTIGTITIDDVDTYYIEEFTDILNSFKEAIVESYEDEKLFNEEHNIKVVELVDFIKNNSESHYFLNESNATLEQDILFKLPYGQVLGLEIEWLGGGIFGFKTYTNN